MEDDPRLLAVGPAFVVFALGGLIYPSVGSTVTLVILANVLVALAFSQSAYVDAAWLFGSALSCVLLTAGSWLVSTWVVFGIFLAIAALVTGVSVYHYSKNEHARKFFNRGEIDPFGAEPTERTVNV